MSDAKGRGIGTSAEKLLERLAIDAPSRGARAVVAADENAATVLVHADLAVRRPDGRLTISEAGRAHLRRLVFGRAGSAIDPFLAQHLDLVPGEVESEEGPTPVTSDAGESPLAWLARRKGRDGHPMIGPVQFQAGERLRADFTRAQMTPRVTSNWASSVAQDRRSAAHLTFSDAVIAARQRVQHALEAAGPEFNGLLLDVCCFLKRLEDCERERHWPQRSAKVVLQLGLDRLARHYGYGAEARGARRATVRTWLAPDASFAVGD
jgi:hypothetical protein